MEGFTKNQKRAATARNGRATRLGRAHALKRTRARGRKHPTAEKGMLSSANSTVARYIAFLP